MDGVTGAADYSVSVAYTIVESPNLSVMNVLDK